MRKMYNKALSLTWHVNVGESPSGKGFLKLLCSFLFLDFSTLTNNLLI